MSARRGAAGSALLAGMLLLAPAVAPGSHAATMRVTLGLYGDEPTGGSAFPSISADGSRVAFVSVADNLVPGDVNGRQDIFVWERDARTITLVSVSSDGEQADHVSWGPAISANGRFVVFYSAASNLVPVPGPARYGDYFLHDLVTQETELVSVSSTGEPQQGNQWCGFSAISGDGRYVVFESAARNLVEGTTGLQLFLRDRVAGTTTLISQNSEGEQGENNGQCIESSISADGRYVAFASEASNLVPDDSNSIFDIFVRDVADGVTTRVSVRSDGSQAAGPSGGSILPRISADGLSVAFVSVNSLESPNQNRLGEDVYVHDRELRTTTRVSRHASSAQMQGINTNPAISGDGRYAAFVNIGVAGWYQVWVHDRMSQATALVSARPDGLPGTGNSAHPALSADGSSIAFSSGARDLVPEGTNGRSNVFLRLRGDTACTNGVREEGAVSGPAHDAEYVSGPGGPVIHEASCIAARWGL